VYLLNRDGKVIRTANENETKAILFKAGEIDLTVEEQAGLPELLTNMPILFDKLGHAYTVEQSIYTPEVIDNLIQFNSGLVNLDIQPQELIIEDSQLTWLAVNSDQPWQIYFEAGKNPQEQLTILKAILDDYFATQDSIKYIDVRFGNRVYVK
jgi:hypothetical protein